MLCTHRRFVSFLYQLTDMMRIVHTFGGSEMSQETTDYPKSAGIISLVGGIIILIGGTLFLAAAIFILPHFNFGNVTVPQGLNATDLPALVSGIVGLMGAFGLICGFIVLISAVMLLAKVGQRRTWGILILVLSILSFVGLGGFVIGAILGIMGGILTLRWKPAPPVKS